MNKQFAILLAIASAILILPQARATAVITYADSASYYMSLGREDEAARKYATAWQYYEKASRYDGCNTEIQLAISDVCLKMKRMAPAIKAMDSATKLRPTDYSLQWRLVQLYFNYDQSNKVIELLPALHAAYPATNGWAYMLGRSYETIQNYGKAIPYMQIAIKEEPGNAEAVYRAGHMFMLMEHYKDAISYYRRYLAMDSSNAIRTYEFALILSTVDQFDSSLTYFQKSLDRGYQPRDDFYMNMANTLANAKKGDQAIALIKGMLERRPGDLGLLYSIADICFEAGAYPEAISFWEQALKSDERNARTIYSIGRAYIRMGKDRAGEQLCERAISMDPSLGVLKHARQMRM